MAYKPTNSDSESYNEQAKIYNQAILSGVLSKVESSLVDFVGIGDSNQLLSGYGWDHGFQFALSQYYDMYATALISANENNGAGGGQGYNFNYSAGADVGAYTGAPAELSQYLGSGQYHDYGYLEDSDTYSSFTGIIAVAAWPGDVNGNLKFRFHYGTFPVGTANVEFQVRRGDSPYSTLGTVVVDPVTGSYGMTYADIDVVAAARDYNISGLWQKAGSTMNGPFFATYCEIINTDRSAGFAYGSLTAAGGYGLRVFSENFDTFGQEALTHYFGALRERQGTKKHICIVINSGLNDRNETGASLGQLTVADGDSSLAFLDNAENIIKQLSQVWGVNGWDRNELTFVLMVSHPVDDPDDSELVSYRNAVNNLCDSYANVCAVNLGNLTDESEMLANDWYASSGADRSHLSQAGYEQIALKIIDAAR